MSKLPAVIWALGFLAMLDVSDYLDFLQGQHSSHADPYPAVVLVLWLGGIVLFWPRSRS